MDLIERLKASTGKVPEGTFFANLSEEQIRAMLLQEEVGKELAENHPEIAQEYADLDKFRTLEELGTAYLQDNYTPEIKRHAVAYAIRQLIPEDELENLQSERKRRALETQFGSFESQEFRDHCTAATKKRNELHGTNVEAMIRGRGRTPWNEGEQETLFEIIQKPEYQLQEGQHTGRPDYELVALELNMQFHDCEEVRTPKAVGNYVRDMRRQGKLTTQ